jgi:hypothetical protein
MSIETMYPILTKIEDDFLSIINNNLEPIIPYPEYMSHYTSISSFMSIMDRNELWFSHAFFLNDPLEISFGINFIINILTKRQDDFSTVINIIEKQRKIHKERSFDLTRELPFIFSFSGLSDELSSWIQYGDSGYGICLDFNYSRFIKSIISYRDELQSHIFFPVQYYSSQFTPHTSNIPGFDKAITDYYSGMEEFLKNKGIAKDQNVQRTLYEITKTFACLIKNDFHAGEREWRYVIFTGKSDENIKIIPTNHGVKMFYKVQFIDEEIIGLIDNIIIGPKHTNDPKIAASLEIFISQKQKMTYYTQFSKGILQ